MNTVPHINSGCVRRSAAVLFLTATLGVTPRPAASAGPSGYGWPVKPFDRPHPVRGNFGDPRTTFFGGPTMQTLMTSAGIFQFHFGIDISTPDGTQVYAVRSGVVSLPQPNVVTVDSGHGFAAEYWHIVPTVKSGQRATAHQTVLGRVMAGYQHVHFTELDDGVAVNPLAAGHLSPYGDTTSPQVAGISFRASAGESEQLPEGVHGSVSMIANVLDMPSQRVPGLWADLPVAPALITWHLARATDGRIVVPEQTAFDVRRTLPPVASFWEHYARGSRANMPAFHGQRAWRVPGVYLYRLTRGPFDTTRIPNGIYRLVVTARDVRGNAGSASHIFIVRNGQAL